MYASPLRAGVWHGHVHWHRFESDGPIVAVLCEKKGLAPICRRHTLVRREFSHRQPFRPVRLMVVREEPQVLLQRLICPFPLLRLSRGRRQSIAVSGDAENLPETPYEPRSPIRHNISWDSMAPYESANENTVRLLLLPCPHMARRSRSCFNRSVNTSKEKLVVCFSSAYPQHLIEGGKWNSLCSASQ